jgi:hypothetical protein
MPSLTWLVQFRTSDFGSPGGKNAVLEILSIAGLVNQITRKAARGRRFPQAD